MSKIYGKNSTNKKQCINEKELHIWRGKTLDHLAYTNYYWSILSEDEQTRAKEFYFLKDRINYIISRGVLRNIISSYTNISPEEIQFGYSEYGKPHLKINHYNKLQFNLSHSKEHFIIGLTKDIDIGIDIEFRDNKISIEDIAKHSCSFTEYKKLRSLETDQRLNYFYDLWVKKESLIKLLGIGLHCDLRDIDLSNNDLKTTIQQLSKVNDSLYNTNILLQTFFSYNGYYSAFALSTNILNKILYFNY